MTAAEWVDKDFVLKGKTSADLTRALNAYIKAQGLEIEEYGFTVAYSETHSNRGTPLPEKFWNLVAFNVEGGSEGWYVHVGAITRGEAGKPPQYIDFGFAKMWTPEKAYELTVAAQRFLSAVCWN